MSADRSRLLEVHADLLERWRGKMNLVGPGPIEVHYDDARAALAGLQPSGHWADLGSGAGFPGVVFAALFPDVALDLVDSRQKRCVFLEEALGRAGVGDDVRVLCQRVEALPDGTYDGLVSRAFAPPEQVLEHARRLLVPGGRVVLFLQAEAAVPASHDFVVLAERPYTVDGRPRRSVELVWSEPARGRDRGEEGSLEAP